jgi:hypothetical protein
MELKVKKVTLAHLDRPAKTEVTVLGEDRDTVKQNPSGRSGASTCHMGSHNVCCS